MYSTIECEIVGATPVMFHNSQLADPANPYAVAIKKVGKPTTEKKAQEIYDLYWEGGLYLDEDRRVVVPGENIESAIVAASGKIKKKGDFKAGLICDGCWRLHHEGSNALAELKADPRFRDIRSVKTKTGNRVMFCRPKFVHWSLGFDLMFDPKILDAQAVVDMVQAAGMYVGLGSYRPKYGRFTIKSSVVISPKPGKVA